jgi:pyridoxamine 5'-phosphate oxidase
MDIASMRKDYKMKSLDESDVLPDGIEQFKQWFQEAIEVEVPEPNSMTLATASAEGDPSARIVLLKGLTDEGFIFFTNYESRKGEELAQNPKAALVFFWQELERQVRIEGRVKKVSREENEKYFYTRPFQSQVSAYVSPQSKVIEGKRGLEEIRDVSATKFEGGKVPYPEQWGGYCVVPEKIEFWQGRESRFHDRLRYTKTGEGWNCERLAP